MWDSLPHSSADAAEQIFENLAFYCCNFFIQVDKDKVASIIVLALRKQEGTLSPYERHRNGDSLTSENSSTHIISQWT